MPRNRSPGAITLTTTLLLAAGCADSPDEDFRQLARQTLHEQSAQNNRLAEQTRQIAEASQQLVEGDAQARRELLEAQRQLTSELHAERASLNRQHDELEQERRDIAVQRQRDPVMAQAIGAVGVTLSCLLPLLLAGYIIYSLNHGGDNDDALSELLVMEIASGEPLLLPRTGKAVVGIEQTPLADGEEESVPAVVD